VITEASYRAYTTGGEQQRKNGGTTTASQLREDSHAHEDVPTNNFKKAPRVETYFIKKIVASITKEDTLKERIHTAPVYRLNKTVRREGQTEGTTQCVMVPSEKEQCYAKNMSSTKGRTRRRRRGRQRQPQHTHSSRRRGRRDQQSAEQAKQ